MPGFRGRGPSSGELKRQLAEDCERAVEAVLSDCRLEGSEFRGHGQDGALWVVETRGQKRGIALNVADPDLSGDLLDLVTHALCGGDRSAGYRWALQYLGGAVNRPMPATQSSRRNAETAAAANASTRKRVQGWYQGALPFAGSPGDEYLAGRGLTRDVVACPELLRFAPRCIYVKDAETNRWTHRPAMLAPVVDPLGEFLALHCTYLEQIAGAWRKVSSKPARKCWGRFGGGVIPLLNGVSNKPLRDAPEGDGCLVGEGIENVLSAAFVRPELRALAAVTAGNLAKIALPPHIGLVVLVVDDDGEKTALDESRERAIDRWRREGRSVERMVPTRGYKDLNDQLQNELGL